MSIRDEVQKFIIWLAKAKQITSIYGLEHNLSKEALNHVFASIDQILSRIDDCTIGIIGEEIAFDKEPFFDISHKRKDFIDHLKSLGLYRISFLRGITHKEMMIFIQALNSKPDTDDPIKRIINRLEKNGVKHISVSDISISNEEFMDQDIADIEGFTKKNITESIEFLEDTYEALKEKKPINMKSLKHVISGLVNGLLANKNLLLMLTSIRLHKEEAFIHNLNVCVFTLMQAELLGIEAKYLMDISSAALLHNIGEITYPNESNDNENESTSNQPFKFIQNLRGVEMLLETEGLSPIVPIAAFEQDINFDMSGFPEKLYGIEANMISMILTIAKYYDEARNKNNESYTGPEIIYNEMIAQSGKKFHPDLLKNFFSAMGVYPPGTLVELDSKEIALVIQASLLDIRRPHVEILYDKNGAKYPEPEVLSLLERDNRGNHKRSINRSIAPLDQYEIPEKYNM